jgi:protein-disulfide isomerase
MAKHSEQRRNESAQPQPGPRGWFYVGMAALAIVGAVLLILALRSTPEGPEVATTAGTPAPAGTPPASGNQPAFPSEFDTLGVVIGAADAPLVVREFADYQCPACGSFAPAAQQLREDYVESGQVRFVFFDFPITSAHPNALAAAQAARCAGKQGRYWEMHDALFQNQPEWSGAMDPIGNFASYAGEIGIDPDALRACVTSGETLPAVQRSASFATQLGVRSTPTVVVGDIGIEGALPYAEIRSLIEQQLTARSASQGSQSQSAPRGS